MNCLSLLKVLTAAISNSDATTLWFCILSGLVSMDFWDMRLSETFTIHLPICLFSPVAATRGKPADIQIPVDSLWSGDISLQGASAAATGLITWSPDFRTP